MRVSKICLGTMGYGTSEWSPWAKDEEESIQKIKNAYHAGINFFDTANTYSNGLSEIILGKALKQLDAPRGRVVIATKICAPVYKDVGKFFLGDSSEDPGMVNGYGLSRKHIFDSVEASLKRLDADYTDLYQSHRLDKETPMEEIMEALNDLVRSGKVRYIGASSMAAWEFQKLNAIAERKGWAKFVPMQNLYNLVMREEEREMNPYCVDAGVAGIPWYPLAMGELAGKNRATTRSETRFQISNMLGNLSTVESNEAIVTRVEEIAKKYYATMGQVALVWMYTKPFVTSPIVGVSKIEQIYDLIGAFNVKLTEQDIKHLEEAYIPRAPLPM